MAAGLPSANSIAQNFVAQLSPRDVGDHLWKAKLVTANFRQRANTLTNLLG